MQLLGFMEDEDFKEIECTITVTCRTPLCMVEDGNSIQERMKAFQKMIIDDLDYPWDSYGDFDYKIESAKTKLIDTNTEDGVPVDLEVLKDAPIDIEEY